MERVNAEEFYEVYKGVVLEYPVSTNHLIVGFFPRKKQTTRDVCFDFCTKRKHLPACLHVLSGYGDGAVLWTLHGSGDPRHRHTQDLQGILRPG